MGSGDTEVAFAPDETRQSRGGDVAEQPARDAGLPGEPPGRAWIRRGKPSDDLRPHPLSRQPAQPGYGRSKRLEGGFVRRLATIPGLKPEEAQDPEIVLANPCGRVADKTNTASLPVGQAAEIVVNRAVGRSTDGVDREIAPRSIFAPVVSEGDHGMPSIGLKVPTKGGDLIPFAIDHGRNRAVIHAGRDGLDTALLQRGFDGLGPYRRRQVDIRDGPAQQCVTDTTADHPGRAAGGGQNIDQPY